MLGIRWCIYFFILPVSLIIYSWINAANENFRNTKKVIFRSKIYRFVFGFPDWIEQVDRSYLVINLFNEFVVIMSLVGWLVLNREQKEGILDAYTYRYDLTGNKTAIEKQRRGLPEESGLYTYGYDPLGRLSKVTKDGEMLLASCQKKKEME